MTTPSVWIIGSGYMAAEYVKVLEHLSVDYLVIARSEDSANRFQEKTGAKNVVGCSINGLCLDGVRTNEVFAFVATSHESLFDLTCKLSSLGITKILVEKPAALSIDQCLEFKEVPHINLDEVHVAFNRRHFASVQKLKSILSIDPPRLMNFNFSEWIDVVESDGHSKNTLENWLFINSSHIIDLAFYLIGQPITLSPFRSGSLPWHPKGKYFCGSGVSESGCIFTYHANWGVTSRWEIEVFTDQKRYSLCPIETLNEVDKFGEKKPIMCEGQNELKPGLSQQVMAFFDGEPSLTLRDHVEQLSIFKSMVK